MSYENSKIYKLVCNKTNQIYYGSTIQHLYQRKHDHKKHYNHFINGTFHYMSSFEIIKEGDYDIVLVEKYPCKDKDELHMRERFYIENNECVNKCKRPFVTEDEKKDKNKETRKIYVEKNKDKIKEKNKKWRESETGIKYYQNNKEIILTKGKLQYEKVKDVLLEKRKEKIVCECGTECRKADISTHKKSKKHQEYIKGLEP
jgi:hypothetical protein